MVAIFEQPEAVLQSPKFVGFCDTKEFAKNYCRNMQLITGKEYIMKSVKKLNDIERPKNILFRIHFSTSKKILTKNQKFVYHGCELIKMTDDIKKFLGRNKYKIIDEKHSSLKKWTGNLYQEMFMLLEINDTDPLRTIRKKAKEKAIEYLSELFNNKEKNT